MLPRVWSVRTYNIIIHNGPRGTDDRAIRGCVYAAIIIRYNILSAIYRRRNRDIVSPVWYKYNVCVCVCVCTLSWWLNLHYVQLVYIKWVLRISHIIIYSTRDLCTIHNAAVIVKYNKRRVFAAQPGAFRIYYCYYNLFLFFSSSTRRWLGESEALCACTVQCAYCIFFFVGQSRIAYPADSVDARVT